MLLFTLLLAAAQTTDAKPSTAPAGDPNKKICRREGSTGTMFAKKVCRTAAEWAAQARANADQIDRVRSPTGACVGGNCQS